MTNEQAEKEWQGLALSASKEYLKSEGDNGNPWIDFIAGVKWTRANLSKLPEVRELIDTINQLKELADNDFVTTYSEDGEKEYWVNDSDLQRACDEALKKLEGEK